jgi:hypothetical protein
MVAHERKIRAGRAEEMCDEDCPHAEARTLWIEALDTLGDRAQELSFLRTRALGSSKPVEDLVPFADVLSEAADGGRRPTGSSPKRGGGSSKPRVASERPRQ